MRAWEVLAQASATTTTAQAVGAQGVDSVGDVWVPLLAALLGALVGGVATLVASVVVKRWELRKTTRIRMYDDLLPNLFEQYRADFMLIRTYAEAAANWSAGDPSSKLLERAKELHRAGVIAGWTEARITEQVRKLIAGHTAYDGGMNLIWSPNEPEDILSVYKELDRLAQGLHGHLERKLRSRYWRRSLKQGDGHG